MYGVGSAGSVGRGLESSLDAVMQYTQENIDRVQQQQHLQQQQPKAYGQSGGNSLRSSMSVASVASSQRGAPAPPQPTRPSSTSRLAKGPSTEDSAVTGDRKFDIVMKKLKLLEDKMKKTESFSAAQHNVIQDLMSQNEKLSDAQRADKKTVSTLKEQVASLKTRIELLLNQDELRDKLSRGPAVDMAYLEEVIAQRVGQVTQRLGDELRVQKYHANHESADAMKSLLQQDAILDKQLQSQANATLKTNKHVVDQISTLEKEVLRLKADNDRIKYKQTYLDKIYSELKETVSIRELKAEETFKKLFQSYRSDLETLTRNTTDRVHEVLSMIQHQDHDLQDLKSAIESQASTTSELLAGFDVRIAALEEEATSITNTMGLLKGKDLDLEDRIKECEAMYPNFLTECDHIHALKDLLHDQAEALQAAQQRQQIVEINAKHTSSHIEGITTNMLTLQRGLDRVEKDFKQGINKVGEELNDYQRKYVDSVQILRESQVKLKAKVKESANQLQVLQETKGAMQQLMQELQRKIHEESATVYETQTALKRMEVAMNVLREELVASAEALVERRMEDVDMTLKDMSVAQEDYRHTWTSLLVNEINGQLSAYDEQQQAYRASMDAQVQQVAQQANSAEEQLAGQGAAALGLEREVDKAKMALHGLAEQLELVQKTVEKKSTELAIANNNIHKVEDALQQWREHLVEKTGRHEKSLIKITTDLYDQEQDHLALVQPVREQVDKVQTQLEALQTDLQTVHAAVEVLLSVRANPTVVVNECVDTADLSPPVEVSHEVQTAAVESDDEGEYVSPESIFIATTNTGSGPLAIGLRTSARAESSSPRRLVTGGLSDSISSLDDFNKLIAKVNTDILALDIHLDTSTNSPVSQRASSPVPRPNYADLESRRVLIRSVSPKRQDKTVYDELKPMDYVRKGSPVHLSRDCGDRRPKKKSAEPPTHSGVGSGVLGVGSSTSNMPARHPDLRKSYSFREEDSDDSMSRMELSLAMSKQQQASVYRQREADRQQARLAKEKEKALGDIAKATSTLQQLEAQLSSSTKPARRGADRTVGNDDENDGDNDDEEDDDGIMEQQRMHAGKVGAGGDDEDESFTQEEEAYIKHLMETPYVDYDAKDVTLDQILGDTFEQPLPAGIQEKKSVQRLKFQAGLMNSGNA